MSLPPVIQTSMLCSAPQDVLTAIALELVELDPLGPPFQLLPFLLTCRSIYKNLCFDNARHLYANVFRFKFDHRAPLRRFGPRAIQTSNVAQQLKQYCYALQVIRRGDIHVEGIVHVFWQAFFMMSENDGRNACQLKWAGLSNFVYRFVRERLWEDRHLTNGWPGETTVNALALWLMWFVFNEETLAGLSPDEREEVKRLIRPYVITALRYPSSHAPDNHYVLPLSEKFNGEFPYQLMTPHGYYPLYRQPEMLVERFRHYGIKLKIQAPLITQAAKLLYFTCMETVEITAPAGIPENRDEANAMGLPEGTPTVVDYQELNTHKSAKFVDTGSWDWRAELNEEQGELEDDGTWRKGLKATSARWDNDWQRWSYCWDPWNYNELKGVVYTYGSLSGLWQGRAIIPDIDGYFRLVQSQTFPESFSAMNPNLSFIPIFMNLREHHCINPEYPANSGGAGNGVDEGLCNAWFPRQTLYENRESGMVTCQDLEGHISRYESYVEGRRNSHNPDTCTQCKAHAEFQEQETRRRIADRLRHEEQHRRFEEIRRQHLEQRTQVDTQTVVERPQRLHLHQGEALRWTRTFRSTVPEIDEFANPTGGLMQPGVEHDGHSSDSTEEVNEHREQATAALGEDVEDVFDAEFDSESGSEDESVDSDADTDSTDYVENTCNGIQDIIVTGETLPHHGMAWFHHRFYGRIRRWDGLVAIVRYEMNTPGRNVWIFRGYVTGDKNLVGSWRAWSDDVTVIPLEGPFVLSKVVTPVQPENAN